VRNTATGEVTPSRCKGALGKWRAQERLTVWTQSRNYGVLVVVRRAGDITSSSGAYASARLSSLRPGKILRGHAAAANRTREIRPSGMRGGLAETCAMEVGLRTSRKLAGTSTESYGGARRISTRLLLRRIESHHSNERQVRQRWSSAHWLSVGISTGTSCPGPVEITGINGKIVSEIRSAVFTSYRVMTSPVQRSSITRTSQKPTRTSENLYVRRYARPPRRCGSQVWHTRSSRVATRVQTARSGAELRTMAPWRSTGVQTSGLRAPNSGRGRPGARRVAQSSGSAAEPTGPAVRHRGGPSKRTGGVQRAFLWSTHVRALAVLLGSATAIHLHRFGSVPTDRDRTPGAS
jgi:hypothetical protein